MQRVRTALQKFRSANPQPERLLNDLAAALGCQHEHDRIYIPVKDGIGFIRRFPIMEGLEIFCWDLQVRHAQHLTKLPLNPGPEKKFTILCTLTPEQFIFSRDTDARPLPDIVFTSLNDDLAITILPGQKVRGVMIHFSADWLGQDCRDADPDLLFLVHDLIVQQQPLFFFEHASFFLQQMFSDIQAYSAKPQVDKLNLKAKSISVLHDLLSRLQVFAADEKKEERQELHIKMLEVEKIIDEHLDKTLPSICVIAKQLALSESTLKRNFKQVYGVGLYEYYLQKKMQLARRMLDEKPIAVKEVAYMLGYEKTSNFIKIFRKFHDLSPGSLKKKFQG